MFKRKDHNLFLNTSKKLKSRKNSIILVVAWLLILWGSFYFLRKYFWQKYTFQKIIPDSSHFISSIVFPELDTTRDVVTTHVENGEWLLVDGSANYVYESSRPKQKGAVIIYGHNTPEVFGNLENLSIGDNIIVKTNANESFQYIVKEKNIVAPDKIDFLSQKEETLVLYTCIGFLDSKRLVITAKPLF